MLKIHDKVWLWVKASSIFQHHDTMRACYFNISYHKRSNGELRYNLRSKSNVASYMCNCVTWILCCMYDCTVLVYLFVPLLLIIHSPNISVPTCGRTLPLEI